MELSEEIKQNLTKFKILKKDIEKHLKEEDFLDSISQCNLTRLEVHQQSEKIQKTYSSKQTFSHLFHNKVILRQYQNKLNHLLKLFFSYFPEKEYYQGFNDIMSVFILLEYSKEEILYYVTKLETKYFKQFLAPDQFQPQLEKSLRQIENRLGQISNNKLREDQIQILLYSKATTQLLTWFTHDMIEGNQLENITKLWRLFLENPEKIIPDYISHGFKVFLADLQKDQFQTDSLLFKMQNFCHDNLKKQETLKRIQKEMSYTHLQEWLDEKIYKNRKIFCLGIFLASSVAYFLIKNQIFNQ